MSSPSIVIFYKNGKKVKKAFINCGWFCDPNTVKRAIKQTLIDCNEVFEWDVAKAYKMEFNKTDI